MTCAAVDVEVGIDVLVLVVMDVMVGVNGRPQTIIQMRNIPATSKYCHFPFIKHLRCPKAFHPPGKTNLLT